MFTDIIINSYLNDNKITCWQEISHARTCRCMPFCPGCRTPCTKFKAVHLLKLHGVLRGWQLRLLRGVSTCNRSFATFSFVCFVILYTQSIKLHNYMWNLHFDIIEFSLHDRKTFQHVIMWYTYKMLLLWEIPKLIVVKPCF